MTDTTDNAGTYQVRKVYSNTLMRVVEELVHVGPVDDDAPTETFEAEPGGTTVEQPVEPAKGKVAKAVGKVTGKAKKSGKAKGGGKK